MCFDLIFLSEQGNAGTECIEQQSRGHYGINSHLILVPLSRAIQKNKIHLLLKDSTKRNEKLAPFQRFVVDKRENREDIM